MKERLKWPLTALAMAALGFLLRRWQMGSAFETDLHLSIAGAPASWAMTAFFALAAALFLLMARAAPVRKKKSSALSRWDLTFAAGGDVFRLTLLVIAALLTLLAALFLFREAAQLIALRKQTGEGDSAFLQVVLGVCAFPGAAGIVFSARSAYRMTGRGRENVLLLLPLLFSCVWLLEAYRSNAADPVLWDYVPLLLASALGLLFQLECAGLAFSEKGHPRRMLWLAGMTAALSGAALGGPPTTAMALLLAGQLLVALAALWTAPGNLRRPPSPDRFGLRARLLAGLPLDGTENGEDTPENDIKPDNTGADAPDEEAKQEDEPHGQQ